jgi:hypothetical protein
MTLVGREWDSCGELSLEAIKVAETCGVGGFDGVGRYPGTSDGGGDGSGGILLPPPPTLAHEEDEEDDDEEEGDEEEERAMEEGGSYTAGMGVLEWLATNGGRCEWCHPARKGLVRLSSGGLHDASELVGNVELTGTSRMGLEMMLDMGDGDIGPGAGGAGLGGAVWVGVDLGLHITLTHYRLALTLELRRRQRHVTGASTWAALGLSDDRWTSSQLPLGIVPAEKITKNASRTQTEANEAAESQSLWRIPVRR